MMCMAYSNIINNCMLQLMVWKVYQTKQYCKLLKLDPNEVGTTTTTLTRFILFSEKKARM